MMYSVLVTVLTFHRDFLNLCTLHRRCELLRVQPVERHSVKFTASHYSNLIHVHTFYHTVTGIIEALLAISKLGFPHTRRKTQQYSVCPGKHISLKYPPIVAKQRIYCTLQIQFNRSLFVMQCRIIYTHPLLLFFSLHFLRPENRTSGQ